MNDLITLDGHMQFDEELPYIGMLVQVDEYDAIVTDVDEDERLVFVDICDSRSDDYLHIYSY